MVDRKGRETKKVKEENYIGIRSLFNCCRTRFDNDNFSIAAINRLMFLKDSADMVEVEGIDDLIEDIEDYIWQRNNR